MAKLQLLLLLFVAALSKTQAGGFETGKRYVYHYENRYGTGLSDRDVRQFAGRGTDAKFYVEFDGKHLIFASMEVKTKNFNERIDGNVFDKLDIEYEPLNENDPRDRLLKEQAKNVFYVDYEDGVIGDAYFSTSSHHEVVNAQKAFVALFQTDFRPLKHDGQHLYMTYEEGTGGDCNTLYHVHHYPTYDHPEADVLNVTKVRFYDQCKYRPHLVHASINGMKCQSCELKTFRTVKNLARTEYKIRGTKNQYVVERIDSTGVIIVAPFSTAGQNILTVTNTTVELIEILSGQEATPLPTDIKKHEHLYYEYNVDHRDYNHADLKEAHHYNRYYEDTEHHHVADAEGYLSHIKSDHEGFEENAKYVAKLIKAFRHFNYDEFVAFFEKNVKPYTYSSSSNLDESSEDEQDVRSVLHRVLPFIGTNPSVKYLFEQIKAEKLSPVSAVNAISTFAFHVKEPSKVLLDYVSSTHFPYHGLDETLQLALGTLVFRGCVKDDFNPHPAHEQTYIDAESCSKYVEGMIEKYIRSEAPVSNTYLRAVVNTRHESSYQFLASILKGQQSADFQHRLIAVWGLFNFVETKSDNLATLFAPIFYNREEDHQIRSYAFEGLLFSKPTPEFFSSLVYVLNEEPNDKLANYIYTSLAAYANTSDPCMEPLKHQIRQTLLFTKPRHRDAAQHGANRMFSVYNAKYNYGRTSHFVTVADNSSFIPRDIYLGHSVNVLGYTFNVVEMGTVGILPDYIIQGLKDVLGKAGLSHNVEQGHIDTKAHGEGNDFVRHPEANFDIYYRHAGQFKHSEDITGAVGSLESLALEVITDKVAISDIVDQVKAGGATVHIRANKMKYIEYEYSIPNEIGLPVVMFVKAPLTLKISGSAGVKVANNKYELDLDLKVGSGFYLKGGVAVKSLVCGNSGYFVKTKSSFVVPIHAKIAYNRAERKVEYDVTPSEQPYDIFQYETTPATKSGGEYLPVRYSEESTNRQYNFGQKYFGRGFVFNFTYDYKWNNYGGYRTFFKDFFRKSSSYEDYNQLADKWFAGSRNFLNYAVFNPSGKPFKFNVHYEKHPTAPTNKVHGVIKRTVDEVPDDKQHLTRVLNVNIEADGPQKRTFELEVKVAYSFPYRDHRAVEVHYKRSAIPDYDAKPFEVCYRSNRQIQNYLSIFSGPKQPKKDVKWEYDGLLTIGADCQQGENSNAKTVTIKGVGEKSEEQLALTKEKLPIYQRCREDYKKGNEFSYACYKVKKDLGRLDKFTFDIKYKNVPQEVRGHFYRVYAFFRHTFYNNLEIDNFHGNNDPNHVKVYANFSYYDPVLDVKIVRDKQTVYYHDIFVPSVVPRYEPITVSESAYDRYSKRIFKYSRPICILSGDYIHTLDHVDYKANIGSCYHVAFGDFQTGNTAVYVAQDGDKAHKKVKIQLSKHVIEVTTSGGDLKVTIDGEAKAITETPVYVPLSTEGDKFAVYRYHRGVSVKSYAHQLYVYTDGKNIKIYPSSLLRGHATGLCGNYDGDSGLEFVNQYGVEYHDVKSFVDEFEVKTC